MKCSWYFELLVVVDLDCCVGSVAYRFYIWNLKLVVNIFHCLGNAKQQTPHDIQAWYFLGFLLLAVDAFDLFDCLHMVL